MGLLDPVAPRYGQGSLAEVMPSVLSVLGMPVRARRPRPRRQPRRRRPGRRAPPRRPRLAPARRRRAARADPHRLPRRPARHRPVDHRRLPVDHPGQPGHPRHRRPARRPRHRRHRAQPARHRQGRQPPALGRPSPTRSSGSRCRPRSPGPCTPASPRPWSATREFERTGLSVSAYRGARFGAGVVADEVATAMLAALADLPPGVRVPARRRPRRARPRHRHRRVAHAPSATRTGSSPGSSTGCRRTRRWSSPPTTGSSTSPADRRLDLDQDARAAGRGGGRGRRAAGAVPAHDPRRPRRRHRDLAGRARRGRDGAEPGGGGGGGLVRADPAAAPGPGG